MRGSRLNYTVTSANFAQPKGTVLSEEQLGTCNIAALVQGGHLVPIKPATKETKDGEDPSHKR